MGASFILHLLLANALGGGAVLAVALARPHAKRWLGARLTYALWLGVPLVMLASAAPARTVVLYVVSAPVQAVAAPAPTSSAPLPPAPTKPADPARVVIGLWIAGAAGFALYLAAGQRRAVARLGRVRRDATDPSRLRASEAGLGPVLLGLVRPRIVVPADFERRFDEGERSLILAHEQAHRASGDTRINGAIALTRVLCWFNPLIHLGARLVRIDQELACDAVVMRRFPDQQRAYAEALFKSQLIPSSLPLGCAWPGRSSGLLRERVEMLALEAPSRRHLAIGGAVALCITLGAGFAAWSAQAPQVRIAQAPSAGAAGSALGAPAQAKVASPPPAAAVAPGSGGAPAPDNPELARAIASGDIRRALELGATAKQIATMWFAKRPGALGNPNPDAAVFVRAPDGTFIVVVPNPPGPTPVITDPAFDGYVPRGGMESLTSFDDVLGRPAPTPDQLALAQMVMSGGTAEQAAAALIANKTEGTEGLAPSGAILMRNEGHLGAVALGIRKAGAPGYQFFYLRGTEGYTGGANLPTMMDVLGPPPKKQ